MSRKLKLDHVPSISKPRFAVLYVFKAELGIGTTLSFSSNERYARAFFRGSPLPSDLN